MTMDSSQDAPTIRTIPANGVGVWRVPVIETPPTDVLAPVELERANLLRRPADRNRVLMARIALRCILGGLVGAPPAALRFSIGGQGKPYLAEGTPGPPLNFNVSHSGAMVLVAVSPNRQVGVDVEVNDPRRDYAAIARRYFDPAECTTLFSLPPVEQLAVFTAIWTRKEAFLKARGTGIYGGLNRFRVTVPPTAAALVESPETEGWALADIACGPGYAAALCAQGRDWAIDWRPWPLEAAG